MLKKEYFMLKKSENGVEWLEFQHLSQEKIVHRIYLKSGDLDFSSPGALSKVAPILNLNKIVKGRLSHSSRVIEISSTNFKPCGFFDAMITNTVHLGLLITHADCQSAILYDPINHALALVHCGWRGNVQSIYSHTIKKMRTHYGTKPENLLVGISPSLGPNYSEFINHHIEFPPSFKKHETTKNYFNLWDIAEEELLSSGVLSNHLEISRLCTFTNSNEFYSYRRDKTTARHGTVAFLT